MSDDQFRELCNTYGFAPSKALRELIDCVRAQEIEACAAWVRNNYMDHSVGSLCEALRARKTNA